LRCVLVGGQLNNAIDALASILKRLKLTDRVLLVGPRDDIPAVMNALDIHVLSSAGESFPNAVAEAMACGTPCVVTDVGDAAAIVGEAEWVVPPRDAVALAKAIERCLQRIARLGRSSLSLRCRGRISDNFSLEKAVSAFKSLWSEMAKEALAGK
jgi:glycosyltransferase involved in cell wall biosynthesis